MKCMPERTLSNIFRKLFFWKILILLRSSNWLYEVYSWQYSPRILRNCNFVIYFSFPIISKIWFLRLFELRKLIDWNLALNFFTFEKCQKIYPFNNDFFQCINTGLYLKYSYLRKACINYTYSHIIHSPPLVSN